MLGPPPPRSDRRRSSSGSAPSPSAAWAWPTCSPHAGRRAPAPDTSVILFWMWGGPSQFETYDPKPDAPAEYRGPFRPIPTAVPGLDLCELFPLQAKLGDKIALIRSLHHTMSAHNDGSIEVLTGKTPARPDPTSTALSEHPDFGMVASRVRGVRPDGMPRYVGIPRQPFMTRPTYLGVAHSAFATGDPSAPDFRPPALTLVGGVDGRRLERPAGPAGAVRRPPPGPGAATAAGAATRSGRRPSRCSPAPRWPRPSTCPARTPGCGTATAGTSGARVACWPGGWPRRARSVITIDALAPSLSERYFSWDDHINVQTRWDLGDAMRHRAPFMDQALSALIEDVYARGLDRKVLIVAAGRVRPDAPADACRRADRAGPLARRPVGAGQRRRAADGPGDRGDEPAGRVPGRAPADAEGPAGDDLPAPGDRSPGRVPRLLRPADSDPPGRRADPGVDLRNGDCSDGTGRF